MQSTISQFETKLKNEVQFLGKKEERYFAYGFKKILCNLENFTYSPNKLNSILHVKWGRHWSIKDTCEIKPHLGSIEGFTVAARMIETFLAIKYDMCEDDISNSKFKKVIIKTKSCSSDFNEPFSVCLVEKDAKIDRIVNSCSEFEITVGNFQFNVFLEFVARSSTSGISFNNFASTTTSSLNNYYYYEGYKLSNIDIKNILIRNGNKTLTATPEIKRSSVKLCGLATNLLPELTFVDFLRIGGQLAQILLYSFDGLKRKNTQNLWIRSLCAEFNEQNIKHDVISKVNLTDVKKVALNNETWRTAIIDLEIGSILATAKVCHILKNNINE